MSDALKSIKFARVDAQVEFVFVLKVLDHHEHAGQGNGDAQVDGDVAYLVELGRLDGHGHRQGAPDQHEGVDASPERVKFGGGHRKELGVPDPVDDVGGEESPEHEDLGGQEHPHPELGGVELLLRIHKVVLQESGMRG
ncbi:MAG: hypothetical protein U5K31_04690 [Balneolaceae bacterium]|nr:hypothetical protein [Balneolaceae bacterium]